MGDKEQFYQIDNRSKIYRHKSVEQTPIKSRRKNNNLDHQSSQIQNHKDIVDNAEQKYLDIILTNQKTRWAKKGSMVISYLEDPSYYFVHGDQINSSFSVNNNNNNNNYNSDQINNNINNSFVSQDQSQRKETPMMNQRKGLVWSSNFIRSILKKQEKTPKSLNEELNELSQQKQENEKNLNKINQPPKYKVYQTSVQKRNLPPLQLNQLKYLQYFEDKKKELSYVMQPLNQIIQNCDLIDQSQNSIENNNNNSFSKNNIFTTQQNIINNGSNSYKNNLDKIKNSIYQEAEIIKENKSMYQPILQSQQQLSQQEEEILLNIRNKSLEQYNKQYPISNSAHLSNNHETIPKRYINNNNNNNSNNQSPLRKLARVYGQKSQSPYGNIVQSNQNQINTTEFNIISPIKKFNNIKLNNLRLDDIDYYNNSNKNNNNLNMNNSVKCNLINQHNQVQQFSIKSTHITPSTSTSTQNQQKYQSLFTSDHKQNYKINNNNNYQKQIKNRSTEISPIKSKNLSLNLSSIQPNTTSNQQTLTINSQSYFQRKKIINSSQFNHDFIDQHHSIQL